LQSEPQQKSIFDFYKRKKHGRPKKHAKLVTDKVEVIKKMPKKQPKHLTTHNSQGRRPPQILFPNWMMKKQNKPRTNWSLAENQLVLKRAVNDWVKKEGMTLARCKWRAIH
jgi:hypothetical protein